jgi:hypothetical protein
MNKTMTMAFLAFFIIITTSLFADDYPLYYESVTKDGYSLIIFHDSVNATYFNRFKRGKGSPWFFFDDHATWGNYPKTTIPSMWIKTKRFRFDFNMKKETLVEIDKTGPRRTYFRIRNEIDVQ